MAILQDAIARCIAEMEQQGANLLIDNTDPRRWFYEHFEAHRRTVQAVSVQDLQDLKVFMIGESGFRLGLMIQPIFDAWRISYEAWRRICICIISIASDSFEERTSDVVVFEGLRDTLQRYVWSQGETMLLNARVSVSVR